MFCPQCAAEYREGFVECADCGVPLVDEAPQGPRRFSGPLVEVFRSADASLLPVVKSVLRGAGIPVVVQGDEAHGLIPLGPVGGGSDERLVGAVLLVAEGDAADAESLLAAFGSGSESEEE